MAILQNTAYLEVVNPPKYTMFKSDKSSKIQHIQKWRILQNTVFQQYFNGAAHSHFRDFYIGNHHLPILNSSLIAVGRGMWNRTGSDVNIVFFV